MTPRENDARAALDSQKARVLAAGEKAAALRDLLFEETARLCSGRSFADFEELSSFYEECFSPVSEVGNEHLFAHAFCKALRAGGTAPPLPRLSRLPEKAKIGYIGGEHARRCANRFFPQALLAEEERMDALLEAVEEGSSDACLLPYLDGEGQPMRGAFRRVIDSSLVKSALYLPSGKEPLPGYLLLTARPLENSAATFSELTLFPESREKIHEVLELAKLRMLGASLPVPPETREGERDPACSCVIRFWGPEEALRDFVLPARLIVKDSALSGFYGVTEWS